MGATTNRYNTLYENMRRNFTVTSGDCHYSLGAYMRMKANEKTHEASLPVTIERKPMTALANLREFVGEKLAVRVSPAPEKMLRKFPLRTSLAACLSALAICTLLFSGAILGSSAVATGTNQDSIALEYSVESDEAVEEMEENA